MYFHLIKYYCQPLLFFFLLVSCFCLILLKNVRNLQFLGLVPYIGPKFKFWAARVLLGHNLWRNGVSGPSFVTMATWCPGKKF